MLGRADRVGRREAAALAVVLAVALALRVAFILGQRGDILFEYPVVDEERYVAMGRALARGLVPDPRPWFHPPGIVYALAVVFRVAGPGLLAPRLVQAAVSTAACALAYLVARRLAGARVAVATAAVCALHGVLVFESCELLPPTWMLAADLLVLWLLLRAKEDGRAATSFGAGAALGVAALFGPTILPFAAVAAAWLRKPTAIGALVAGIALPIAPVTWGNWQRGHELVLVSTNGGINFAIGNDEHYPDMLSIRPGPRWDELRERPRRARAVGEAEASSYFLHEGLRLWLEHPLRAAALYGRKLYLYFDGPEIPRDTDIETARDGSALLGLLVTRGPPWLPDGLLIPAAIAGAAACWAERRRLALLFAFVALQALVTAAFFATSRYRVPALPVFAFLACAGVARIARSWPSERSWRRLAAPAAFFGLVPVLNVPTRESAGDYAAELDFYRGLELRTYLHDPERALGFFRKATAENPSDARFWLELGNTLDALRRSDEAIEAWKRAGEVDPWDLRPRRKAASALAARGDLDGAIALLRLQIGARARPDASYAPDHMRASLWCAQEGRDACAAHELGEAARADPMWVRTQLAGFTRAALGVNLHVPTFWGTLAHMDADAGIGQLAGAAADRAAAPH